MDVPSPRRAAAGATLVLAVIGLAWFLGLTAFGGFDARLLGIPLTSNDPRKPFVGGAICLGLYLWLTRNETGARRAIVLPARLAMLAEASVPLALALAMTIVSWIYSTKAVG